MRVESNTSGYFAENCYAVFEDEYSAWIIDPGWDYETAVKMMDGRKPTRILLTHGHIDHIYMCPLFLENYHTEIYIHRLDMEYLRDSRRSNPMRAPFFDDISVDSFNIVEDGDVIEGDSLRFEVIHTPGHTPGSVCYRSGNILFSGDTLFCGSIGRTDFPGGSPSDIRASLKKLASLPDDTVVYPGHSEITTIGDEKQANPFLIDTGRIEW